MKQRPQGCPEQRDLGVPLNAPHFLGCSEQLEQSAEDPNIPELQRLGATCVVERPHLAVLRDHVGFQEMDLGQLHVRQIPCLLYYLSWPPCARASF